MTAAKLVLEPVFEAQFTEANYGFGLTRSAIDACEAPRVSATQGRGWLFEAAIRDCFGTIDHLGAEAHDRWRIPLPPPLTPRAVPWSHEYRPRP